MFACMYTYLYLHTFIFICMCACVRVHACLRALRVYIASVHAMLTCAFVPLSVHLCASLYMRAGVCACVCVPACVCLRMCGLCAYVCCACVRAYVRACAHVVCVWQMFAVVCVKVIKH